MIQKKIFGKPIDTGAITAQVEQTEQVRHFDVSVEEKRIIFTCPLSGEDVVYGLGETMGKLNKRGGRYISFNTDTADHTDSNPSIYASHNLLIVDGAEKFGVFFDTPARVTFEIDYRGSGQILVICDTRDLVLYQIENDSPYAITRDLLRAIGPCYLPPLWAFGYGQSRFGYDKEQDFRNVAGSHEENGIPLDYICMDIDYMEKFKDFSFNTQKFPDMKAFSAEMRNRGIHLVPIVDAGVKIEPGDPVYEEGVKKGYFCRNKEGGYFGAGVWPGMTHFPDFLNSDARCWFGQQYKFYTDLGIEGFWNDMNEPAIFYSEYTKGPKKLNFILDMVLGDKRKAKKERDLVRDYKSFFHNMDGKRLRHYDVHNLYGAMMTRASSEGLRELLDHRFLLFARSSYIGASRYGGVWTGDNTSKWEHLLLNMRHAASLNMCGFLYSGADTGGFMGNCTRELLLRWLAFSCFTPLMRNHTSKFTQNQEAYQFGDTTAFRKIISLRYRLLPYIYSEYMKAALTGDMYIKPLAFEYPQAKGIEDQLLVGDSLMIAPIIREGETERKVFVPEQMTMVRYDGQFHCEPIAPGKHTIKVPTDQVVLFIRKGKLLPVGKAITNTREYDVDDLTLLGDGHRYELYTDDGLTWDCTLDKVQILQK